MEGGHGKGRLSSYVTRLGLERKKGGVHARENKQGPQTVTDARAVTRRRPSQFHPNSVLVLYRDPTFLFFPTALC